MRPRKAEIGDCPVFPFSPNLQSTIRNPKSRSPHPTPGAPAEAPLQQRATGHPRRARATPCRVCAAASPRSCVSSRSLACASRTYTGFLPKRSPFADISDSKTSQLRAAASVQPALAPPLVTQSAGQVTDIPIFIRRRTGFTPISDWELKTDYQPPMNADSRRDAGPQRGATQPTTNNPLPAENRRWEVRSIAWGGACTTGPASRR